jgi:poly-gamma-glutamate capsule biosynthesis protein CapA/YwtB (metallophosphatase superfamily)
VAVGLLAMPLSERARPRRTGVLGVPAFAHALKWAGYDMISVANNRLLDAEMVGLLDTGPALEKAGLAWGGAGRNLEEARRPVIVERKGVKLAFLSSTYGVFGFEVDGFALPDAAGVMAMDRFLIREDIKRIKDQVDS